MRISLNFTCKYCISFSDHYVFTERPKMLVNIKTGRVIDQVMKGGSIGYIIDSKFYSLTNLRKYIQKIQTKDCPF